MLKAPRSTTRDSTAMLRVTQARRNWSTSHHASSLSSETLWARSTASKSLTKALLSSNRTRPWFSRTMVSSNWWRNLTHSSVTQIRAADLSTTAPRTWSCRTWTWVPSDHHESTTTFQSPTPFSCCVWGKQNKETYKRALHIQIGFTIKNQKSNKKRKCNFI